MAYTYDFKVVVSGKQVEVFKYKKNIWREYDSPKDEQIKKPKQLNIFEQQKLKEQHGGSVHYHLLCNLPYIEMSALEWLWGQGMVNIRETGQVNNLGAYMSKYLGKELFTGRMFGKKKYFRSQSLSESVELIGWYAMKFVEKFLSLISPVFEKTFYSEWVGMVDYKAFTLGFVPFKNGFERNILFNSV